MTHVKPDLQGVYGNIAGLALFHPAERVLLCPAGHSRTRCVVGTEYRYCAASCTTASGSVSPAIRTVTVTPVRRLLRRHV